MQTNQALKLIKRAALLLFLLTLNPQLSILYAQGAAFTYQGRLNDGASSANGSYDFRFRIAPDPFASVYVAPAIITNNVPVANGVFTVTLDFGAGVFTGAGRWLEIGLRTNGAGAYSTLSPLQALTAAPYAIMANSASNLLGSLPANQLSGALPSAQLAGAYAGAVALNNSANSFTGDGSGLTAVNAFALGGLSASGFWKLTGNAVAPGQFIGSTNFQAVEIRANGLRGWRVEPDPRPGGIAPNLIGGSTNNVIEGRDSGGNVIVGGGRIAQPNVVHSNSSGVFIGAGSGNHIGPNVNDAVIGGGERNAVEVNAHHATIGGGYQNTIQTNAIYAIIGGGGANTIQTNASYSTVGGGYQNTIQSGAFQSTIGGGEYNTIQTNAQYSIIAGGANNAILANAQLATIPGGYRNRAASYAFAAGQRAKANHTGAFVWADSTDADFASGGSNQFCIRAGGGVLINTASNPWGAAFAVNGRVAIFTNNTIELGYGIPGKEQNAGKIGYQTFTPDALDIVGAAPNSGFRKIKFWCEGGATFTGAINSPSDRKVKRDFQTLDTREVLEKVVAMPVQRWAYKADAAKRHIGPVAQDFHAAFGLNGDDDTTIATVDADGVALAAIQGLNQKVEAKDAEIQDLRLRLEKLEQLVRRELSATVP